MVTITVSFFNAKEEKTQQTTITDIRLKHPTKMTFEDTQLIEKIIGEILGHKDFYYNRIISWEE